MSQAPVARTILGRALLLALLALVACTVAPHAALAGQWVQVSCDQSATASQGWSSSSNTPTSGSVNDPNCSPSQPMTASLSSTGGDAAVQSYELLTYTPPAGSTLAGGTISISGSASGIGNASGTSVVYSPQFVYPSDVIYQCAHSQGTCQNGNYGYTAQVTLPSDAGGDLYLEAGCGGGAGTTCSSDTLGNGTYSAISLSSADLLLANSSVPAASDFGGTLLGSDPPGAASLLFTASDQNGPGVYNVTVSVDGTSVYSATPNPNNGACASIGTYAGTTALEFDSAQPCPQEESVDVPVSTSGLAAGNHEVTATVTDAAGNTATVLDQEITIPSTSGAGTTSTAPTSTTGKPKITVRYVKARVLLNWGYSGLVSRLVSYRAVALARTTTISLSDTGPRHPKLKLTHASAKHFKTLMRDLEKLRFYPGDTLTIAFAIRGEKTQRVLVRVRKYRVPVLTPLKYR